MQNEICFQRIQLTFNMLTQEFAFAHFHGRIKKGKEEKNEEFNNNILLYFVPCNAFR